MPDLRPKRERLVQVSRGAPKRRLRVSRPTSTDGLENWWPNVPAVPLCGILEQLTSREQEVLRLFLCDPNDKRIARCLGCRPQTVTNHLAQVTTKLGVESRAELAIKVLLALLQAISPKAVL